MMQFNQELHILLILMSQATPQQVGEEESRPQDFQMTGFGLQKRREETNNLFLQLEKLQDQKPASVTWSGLTAQRLQCDEN